MVYYTSDFSAILQKILFSRFDPGKWLKIQKNILSNFQFIAAILIFFRFRVNHDFVTPGDTPVPAKTLFLDFRPGKTHIAPKKYIRIILEFDTSPKIDIERFRFSGQCVPTIFRLGFSVRVNLVGTQSGWATYRGNIDFRRRIHKTNNSNIF